MRKILILPLMLSVVICINAKVEDNWRGDFREVSTQYEKYKGGWPPMRMSIQRRINSGNPNDTIDLFVFSFYTFSTEDESFRKGDEMLIRLGNDEVIKGSIYYTADPKASVTYSNNKNFTDLPDRLPGYKISNEDYQKLGKHGIKKIRINHSKGFYDYEFTGKDFQNFNKKFIKNYNEVNEQAKKRAPYRPSTKIKEF